MFGSRSKQSQNPTQIQVRKTPSYFSFPSFKDIETLCSPSSSDNDNDIFSKRNHLLEPSTTRRLSVFHRVRLANTFLRAFSQPNKPLPGARPEPEIRIPGSEHKVVLYYTSLRIVRKTFDECRAVQAILRGFRVAVDERDVSMDSSFLNELARVLGCEKTKLTLPRVFVGGRYVGGAEEVRAMHESGELKRMVEGLPREDFGGGGACEACGGFKFVVCEECRGSRKCYGEKSGGFRSCTSCNENGLVRCNSCSN